MLLIEHVWSDYETRTRKNCFFIAMELNDVKILDAFGFGSFWNFPFKIGLRICIDLIEKFYVKEKIN